ncbi:uncharacterized protein LOC100893225 [Strongylocentrotus purpuratus]|uniref:protein-tyrosine-phosphatase n=1 Tax=Strongylocentrotus purpuratus TaxID=7668 RepID=A0A7M7NAR2_STRPU|nr:uncharacterized protein LOC100893225 [Strongylocentrotus purpuratus]
MDSRFIWSCLFSLVVLVVSVPRLAVALEPPNHVDGYDPADTQGPMVEPGQPLVTPPPIRDASTPRSAPVETPSPTPSPSPTNSTTVANTMEANATVATTKPNSTMTASSMTATSVTRRLTPSLTVPNATGTVSKTSRSTASGTPSADTPLSGIPASTDKSTVAPTAPIQQGTTNENNTGPVDLYSTPPLWTWWDSTTKAATGTRTPTARATILTTRLRTTHRQTTPYPRKTTSFPWTTSQVSPQTTRPTTVVTQPKATTTQALPNKNRTSGTVSTTTTMAMPTTPTTIPWHWPFPTTTQTTTLVTTASQVSTGQSTEPGNTPSKEHPVRTPTLYPITTLAPPVANASYKLPTYLQLRLSTTWPRFCKGSANVQESLADFARQVLGQSPYDRVEVPYLNVRDHCREATVNRFKKTLLVEVTPVDFFVTVNGSYYENVTQKVGAELVLDHSMLQEDISYQIISAHVLVINKAATPAPPNDGSSQGAVIGATLTVCALVFGVILSLIGMKVYRVRKSHAGITDRYYFDGKQLQDALSESHQMAGVSPLGRATGGGGHPAPSYREYILASINKGLVLDDEDMTVEVDAVEALPSHTLTSNALAKFYSYREAIAEEFENLPGHQLIASSDIKKRIAVPVTSKPRSPVVQSPERTRVPIPPTSPTSPSIPSKPADLFLDASFIRGYDSSHCSYIGATVSGGDSSTAFWRTVWEQQSRTIVCLCSPYELGKVCPQYWPTKEGGPGTQLYGNILVTLKGGASGEHYFTSTLLIRNVEKSLCRPVTHYWFSNWLDSEIPSSPQALMSMLLQVHNTHQESYGPVVVHCSDGVGRTGLVIATDINMQRLEESHTVDIPHTVSSIRQDRGQAILNIDQYAFIYRTLYEFSKFLSSSGTKETSDTESVVFDNPDDSVSDTGNEDLSSQGTNSSRTSSYLGDLSSSVKRRLALKFPSLGISPPTPLSPISSRISTGEFVVINSPNSTNLDMSVVSGLSGSEKGDRNSSASSHHSPFDQTSFCTQNDVFAISHNDSARLVPKGSGRHFTVGQRPLKRETSVVSARPVSAFCRGSRAMSSIEGSKAYEEWSPPFGNPGQSNLPQSLSSPKTDLRVEELSKSNRERSATCESGRFSDSLASTNPFKFEESHHELCASQPNALVVQHAREPSYPTDMNPFGSSQTVTQLDSPFTSYPPSSSVPSALYDPSENHSHSRQNSNPFPSEPSSSNPDSQYPKEINPFEAPSETGDAFAQSSESGSSLNSAFAFVSYPDTAGNFERQGTYPKGINPFDESGSLQRIPLPSSQRGASNALRLAPVPRKQNKAKSGRTEGQASSDGQNPFDYDWMDSAEESFT